MDTIPIATRKSVIKDIDPTTLHRLYYEEGMTIKAIAALCGICAATVRKHLGPVRRGPRPQAKKKNDALKAVIAKKVQVPVEQVRPKQLIQSKIELKGRIAKFEVDIEAGSLYARGAAFEMLLAKEDVEQFIWELVEAYECMPRRAEPVADGAEPTELFTKEPIIASRKKEAQGNRSGSPA